MRLSRYAWAWRAGDLKKHGWKVDGGVWPYLRLSREQTLTDLILSAGSPIQDLIFNQSPVARISREKSAMWKVGK